MRKSRKFTIITLAFAVAGLGVWRLTAGAPSISEQRTILTKAYNDGNFKAAFEGLRKLALDPKNDATLVGKDLELAINSLYRLGRTEEVDDFRESVIKLHEKNWRLLATAARTFTEGEHYGFMVAGQFKRGGHRGGGHVVNSLQRDRTRALQLMEQAVNNTKNENDKAALASLHLQFANLILQGAGYADAWRLQYLTDLSKLPDYEDGYWQHRNRDHSGAPVDEKGNAILHKVPKSYTAAETDGERWRWLLVQTMEFDANRTNEVDLIFADFMRSQLGVQTMAHFGWRFGGIEENDEPKSKTGTFALHTLKDNETIARLATGLKRFGIPDEYNWIKIYLRVADRAQTAWGERALGSLAQEFEDRRQYPRGADFWKRAIKEYGPGANNYRQQRLDQIVGNWGRFENVQTQLPNKESILDFRFRNGNKVNFEAHEINVAKLLDDVKAYLVANPGNRLDGNKLNVQNIGHRLVFDGQTQYLKGKVHDWAVDLKPRPAHIDERVTLKTPKLKPGAYLITGQMANGNMSRIVVWVNDTIIIKKMLDNQSLYYVADAVTGAPLENADVEFFGWKQVQVQPNKNLFNVLTTKFRERTDKDGQIILGENKLPRDYQWLVTATTTPAAAQAAGSAPRHAYLGFTNVWYNRIHDQEYNADRTFVITDRPVYRPENTVQFKMWTAHSKYDQPDASNFAGQAFKVRFHDPKGQKIFDKNFTADEYGGIQGEFPTTRNHTLGSYRIDVLDPTGNVKQYGSSTFRIEEYKKPEFEVKIDAPTEPVKLGDKITATIESKYYFGAPVTSAVVKFKVMRQPHSSRWYPVSRWDWMYGNGYWWFAADYDWYPGFAEWGCRRPIMPWWGHGQEPPELVMEAESPIGPDGKVEVVIDTATAKELHGNQDHKYSITAEVTDQSRRTIVGQGDVLVARKAFKIYTWLDKGHYRSDDTIKAHFKAQTLDQKPVQGKGELTLYQISYNDKNEPVEKAVETWKLDTNAEGTAMQQIKAAKPGQFRLAYKLTAQRPGTKVPGIPPDTIEGGYVFLVMGQGFDSSGFRFNDIELVADKKEYNPGDKVKLNINVNKSNGTVLLFSRPTNGIYLAPKLIRLKGKSVEEELTVAQRDMPNFFVEVMTIADGRVHSETRELVVPPEKRVVNVEVVPSQQEYKPGQKVNVKLKLTDIHGKPFVGSTVVSVYDKSVEYISGGSNVPEIKQFFWKGRRHHHPQTESSLQVWSGNQLKRNEIGMNNLGVFGATVVEEWGAKDKMKKKLVENESQVMPMSALTARLGGFSGANGPADSQLRGNLDLADADKKAVRNGEPGNAGGPQGAEPTIRKNFADTAYWTASLKSDKDGLAEVTFDTPDQLTAWKIRVWTLGHGTKVGQGEAEFVTKKDLIVRMQAPRFFTQKDEVVLSANIHNYLKKDKLVCVTLEFDGGTLEVIEPPPPPIPNAKFRAVSQEITIKAGGEQRVDWRVKAVNEGEAIVRMKAVTDEDSDAMEMRFPVFVHGMLKMESFTGVIRPDKDKSVVTFSVPAERRVNESVMEVRYSPTLAGAMIDALPYLVDYPYGCTEQTLNRFLPTVITQRVLQNMKLDLKEIEKNITNLNSAEIGDDRKRVKDWQRLTKRSPVFNEDEVKKMSQAGVIALQGMQLSDGGWGWFSGNGERSWPHTTAVVVHGLQLAKANDVNLPQNMLERGVEWLKNYQAEQVRLLHNAPSKTNPYKEHADNLDAMVYMTLVDSKVDNTDMRDFLYRDRTHMAVYAKAMFGLALHKQQQKDKLAMIMENIEQYLVSDDENQTAYLKMPESNAWWYWYGNEIEANAYYLKLLSLTGAKDEKASRLVKYLLNNRRHATYWKSTRDTAVCVEAFADYIKMSGEDRPDMTVEVWLDGKKHKEVHIDKSNLFSFDNKLVLVGDKVTTGKHTLEIKRKGSGPVYFNAYVTNFTLEDFITKAGLEVKVNRKYYKLTRVEEKIKVSGSKGQALDQAVEKYTRAELANLATVKSGDLIEIELEIDSKNDYEYLIFEDPKAAGFEPFTLKSGYVPNTMGAYMELRDEKVAFFVRHLARGKHSISYRMRAEIPGQFSALPTRAYAMYAPELKGNSDEIKIRVEDRPLPQGRE